MEGTLHVIEQLGIAHKNALALIEQQAQEIAQLREALAAVQATEEKA